MSFKYTKSWKRNHTKNSFKKIVGYILRSHKLTGIMFVRPFNLIFFGNQFFRFDMQKESSKIFIDSNIIIFQSSNDIVVFSFSMWSLTRLGWICKCTIQKKWFNLSKCWLFVQFRTNLKRLETSLRHLGVIEY